VTKVFFSVSLFLFFFAASAQNDFKSYKQKLQGTSLSFEMVPVKGGEFIMGNNQGKEDAKPEHKTEVSPFWMSSLEVSWDLYEPFLYKDLEIVKSTTGKVPEGVDAITRPTKPYLDMTFGMGKLGKPAVGMTQYNAIQFCKWLYTRTGVFYRLPTEAEWEFAAKAGFSPEQLSKIEDYAWYEKNSENSTQNVGTKLPNNFGIYDLLGNVAEWTYDQYNADLYKSRDGKHSKNPIETPVELYPNSVRGGSYLNDTDYVSTTARDYSDPSWKQIDPQVPKSDWWVPDAPFVGIRLVRPLNPPSKEEIMKYYDKKPIKDF
jgi:sulfatase modifying factor 1